MENNNNQRIEDIKKETSEHINVPIEDLDYITLEFITEFEKEDVKTFTESDGEVDPDNIEIRKTKGNSVWSENGIHYWKSGTGINPQCGTSRNWQSPKNSIVKLLIGGQCLPSVKHWVNINITIFTKA